MLVSPDVTRWVQEGERLFGRALAALQQVEHLASDNQRLREELEALRHEVGQLQRERVQAAESLKAIAEQVTRLATAALQRLGRPTS
jgi:hypothetical protein